MSAVDTLILVAIVITAMVVSAVILWGLFCLIVPRLKRACVIRDPTIGRDQYRAERQAAVDNAQVALCVHLQALRQMDEKAGVPAYLPLQRKEKKS